jgi:hypothetical protein
VPNVTHRQDECLPLASVAPFAVGLARSLDCHWAPDRALKEQPSKPQARRSPHPVKLERGPTGRQRITATGAERRTFDGDGPGQLSSCWPHLTGRALSWMSSATCDRRCGWRRACSRATWPPKERPSTVRSPAPVASVSVRSEVLRGHRLDGSAGGMSVAAMVVEDQGEPIRQLQEGPQ